MSCYVSEEGRPFDLDERLDKEIRCYDLLDRLGIRYQRCDHPAAETMEKIADAEKVLGINICKNLFLCNRQKTDFYLLMMPGNKKFLTKELSNQLGCARLSFAGSDFMEEFLDITPGSVSVLGLMNDKENRVRLLIDEDLLNDEFIGCHPCINTTSLKISTKDLIEIILKDINHNYTVVSLSGKENDDV